MIQRIQSVWLLLAAVFAAVTFRFPFYTGVRLVRNAAISTDLNAQSNVWLGILTVFAGGLAFVNIFLFKNRKTQLKLCYLGIFLSIILLVMYFMEMGKFTSGSISLWCIFPFAIFACYILATRGIMRDERLIRSMDRLR